MYWWIWSVPLLGINVELSSPFLRVDNYQVLSMVIVMTGLLAMKFVKLVNYSSLWSVDLTIITWYKHTKQWQWELHMGNYFTFAMRKGIYFSGAQNETSSFWSRVTSVEWWVMFFHHQNFDNERVVTKLTDLIGMALLVTCMQLFYEGKTPTVLFVHMGWCTNRIKRCISLVHHHRLAIVLVRYINTRLVP